jgi:hypothetical protein
MEHMQDEIMTELRAMLEQIYVAQSSALRAQLEHVIQAVQQRLNEEQKEERAS